MASSAGRQPRRLKAAHKEGSVGARADAIAEMQKMARSPRGRALLRYNKAGWGQKKGSKVGRSLRFWSLEQGCSVAAGAGGGACFFFGAAGFSCSAL